MPDNDEPHDDLRRILALRGFPGIDSLGLPEVTLIASNMVERYLPAGTIVVRANTRPSLVHFVLRGRIDSTSVNGVELAFGPRSIFGVLTGLSGELANSDAVAGVDTWTLALTNADIDELLDEHFTLVRGVARTLAAGIVARLTRLPISHLAQNFAPSPAVVPEHELGLAERILVLRSQQIGIGPKRIQALASIAREAEELRLAQGTTVWRHGDAADASLVILDGRLRVERADGQSLTVSPVQLVGGLEALGSASRWYDLVCETDARVLRIERRQILDVLEDHTQVAREMVGGLARTLDRLLDVDIGQADARPSWSSP